jgi:hypothetical protein
VKKKTRMICKRIYAYDSESSEEVLLCEKYLEMGIEDSEISKMDVVYDAVHIDDYGLLFNYSDPLFGFTQILPSSINDKLIVRHSID